MNNKKHSFDTNIYSKIATIYFTLKEEEKNISGRDIAKTLMLPRHVVERYLFVIENKDNLDLHTDEELREVLNKTSAKLQRFMDTNNMLRKVERESVRSFNTIEALNEEVIKLLKTNPLQTTDYKKIDIDVQDIKQARKGGIIQWSDWHGNELISLPGINTFNFPELSRKVHKHVFLSKKDFKNSNIKHVLVIMTGDMLNSDRRLSEKLHQATNRAKAALLTANIMASALIDIARDFIVHVMFVSGNESRIHEEHGFEELLMTDNYDYTIANFAKEMTKFHKNINWLPQQSYVEEPVIFCNKNLLITHGDARILQGDVERGVIQLCGKWANNGYMIDFVFFGHLHYTRIGDHFARSGSMPGANAYSNRALQLISKSSQLSHEIIGQDIFTKRYDLDYTEGYKGYTFDRALEAYNPKSFLKTKANRPIITITAL